MKRAHFALLLFLLPAAAFARDPGGRGLPARALPPGREGREAARECFAIAQTIRATGDAAEKAALTARLREKVAGRHAARIEADKQRVAAAEREIAERHAAALRALDAIKARLAEAEARQSEDVDREVEALLAGKEGFSPRGPGPRPGLCRRGPRPAPDAAPAD